jgi:hypothetical protein
MRKLKTIYALNPAYGKGYATTIMKLIEENPKGFVGRHKIEQLFRPVGIAEMMGLKIPDYAGKWEPCDPP